MFEIGDTVTIIYDHIYIGGNISLKSGQQLIIRNLIKIKSYWCGDYWIPEKVIGVLLEEHYGVYPLDCFCESNIGKKTFKGTRKPFKSGLFTNTIKGVIIHPKLNIPAYTFIEDDSYFACKKCLIYE